MIALCYHAMKDVSPTDVEWKWKKPTRSKKDDEVSDIQSKFYKIYYCECNWFLIKFLQDVKTINEIYQSKDNPNVFGKPVTEDDISNLVKRMSEVSLYCGLAWIAEPEPSQYVQTMSFLAFQEIISSEGFLSCNDPAAYLMSALCVT